jgi:hypothetical protein
LERTPHCGISSANSVGTTYVQGASSLAPLKEISWTTQSIVTYRLGPLADLAVCHPVSALTKQCSKLGTAESRKKGTPKRPII